MRHMPATVLVVDDDPVIQKLLQVNFEMEGYSVITAGDGEEGLAKTQAAHPVAVVLDVMMPKLDGLEVARRLKSDLDAQGIALVLLSANAQQAAIQAATATGAAAALTRAAD